MEERGLLAGSLYLPGLAFLCLPRDGTAHGGWASASVSNEETITQAHTHIHTHPSLVEVVR